MNYDELETKLGKKTMSQCSELYKKYVLENMGKGKAKDLWNGVDTYLARITPLLGGGVNTKELLEHFQQTLFYDQVVILTLYLERQKENKGKREKVDGKN
jgi:hypothetical protein